MSTDRRARRLVATAVAWAMLAGCAAQAPAAVLRSPAVFGAPSDLPAPDTHGTMPLEQAIEQRRSVREFASRELPIEVVGQLLWAAQGITGTAGRRSAPSAGGLYPLEVYVVERDHTLHYIPAGHRVTSRPESDPRPALQAAALGQRAVGSAPALVVIASVPSRTEAKYGSQARDFVNREAGHAAQNVLLEATALGLASVVIGGFDPVRVRQVLALPPEEEVLYLIPVGYPG